MKDIIQDLRSLHAGEVDDGSYSNRQYVAALDALLARVETAERERDELRKDKERLDWLQTFTVRVDDVLRHFVCCDDVDIRASIDAAMRKEKL